MPSPLEDIEALFDAVKRFRDERRKMERLSEKAFNAEGPKAISKANVDLNWQAVHVNRIEAEVHAKAVDCGVADLREPEHYGERISHNSSWHKYPWTPARPRALGPAISKARPS